MSSLSAVCRALRSSPRIVAVVWGAALLEGMLRLGLVVLLEPYFGSLWVLAAVTLWPPVVAAVGLAVAASMVQQPGDGADTRCDEDAALNDVETSLDGGIAMNELESTVERLLPVVAITPVAHGIAIIGGIAFFLLVDTPIRYLLYWAGSDGVFSFEVVVYGPFVGIAIGTLVVWAVPAIAVVAIGRGAGTAESLRRALVAPISRPLSVAVVMVAQLASISALVGVSLAIVRTGERLEGTGLTLGPIDAVFVVLVAGGMGLAFGATVWLAGMLVLIIDRFDEPSRSTSATDRLPRSALVLRLALAVLVVTALVTTAGAVRTAEIRPMDTDPEPLPDEPDELYATALENTDRASHAFRWVNATDDEAQFEIRVDRTDRQLFVSLEGVDQYYTHGVFYHGEPMPLPGYVMLTDDEIPRLGEASPDAENWTVAADDGDEITLELTDPDDVHTAVTGDDLEEYATAPKVRESWARITIDAERGTLSAGELRLNVSDPAGSSPEYDTHVAYEYDVDIEVERPDDLGSPGVSEWIWRLFAY